MSNYSLIVSGKVQGVYYRKFVAENADRLCLSGFVENRYDGSVYIEVTGEDNHVNSLINLCNVGPPDSGVTKIVCSKIDTTHFGYFYIKH